MKIKGLKSVFLFFCVFLFFSCEFTQKPTSDSSTTTPAVTVAPPATPTGIAATAGDATVKITWTPVTGASSYNLYWSTTNGVSANTGKKIANATIPCTLQGLTNGKPCYFVVTAVNAGGESAISTQASATPQAASSGIPLGVELIAGTAGTRTTIKWTDVTGATGYNLYWSTTSGVTTTKGTKIPNATNPYYPVEFPNDTTYYFVVTAVTSVGESAASSEVALTPQANGITNVPIPANVTATAGALQATVSWNTVTNATSYNLYYSTSTGVTKLNGTKIANVTSPYTHTGLANGLTYYYVITAVTPAGESAASAQTSAAPKASATGGTTDIPIPANVNATAGVNQATVSWDSAPNAISYNLYWSTSTGVTKTNGTKIERVYSPYNHTGLATGLTYYYVITTVTAAGESAASVEASAKPLSGGTTTPDAPTGLSATYSSGKTIVTWISVPFVTSYNLYWSTNTGDPKITGTKIEGVTSPYTHTGFVTMAGMTYNYVVTAVLSGVESAESTKTSVVLATTPTTPAAPTGLVVSGTPTSSAINLTWDSVPNALSYNLYYSTNSGVTTTNGTKIANVTSPYNHSLLASGTTYYYIVTAVTAAGESAASAQTSGTTQVVVTVPAAPSNLAVSGTPTTSAINLTWSSVPTATSYNVYWSTSSGVTKTNGTKIASVTSPYNHTGLTSGTNYYYIVTAVNAGGESAASTQLSATTQATVAAPATPSGLAVSGTPTSSGINLTWNSVPNATTYYLYSSTSSNGTYTRYGSGTTGTSLSVSGLSSATTYYFKVSASNAGGESAQSSPLSGSTIASITSTAAGGIASGTYANTTSGTSSGIAYTSKQTYTFNSSTGTCTYVINSTTGGTTSTVNYSGTYTYDDTNGLKMTLTNVNSSPVGTSTMTMTTTTVYNYPDAFTINGGTVLQLSNSKKTSGTIGVVQGTYTSHISFTTTSAITVSPPMTGFTPTSSTSSSTSDSTSTYTDTQLNQTSVMTTISTPTPLTTPTTTYNYSYTWTQAADGTVTSTGNGITSSFKPLWITKNGAVYLTSLEYGYTKQ